MIRSSGDVLKVYPLITDIHHVHVSKARILKFCNNYTIFKCKLQDPRGGGDRGGADAAVAAPQPRPPHEEAQEAAPPRAEGAEEAGTGPGCH